MDAYLEQLGWLAPECLLTALALGILTWDLLKKGRDSTQLAYATLVGLAITTWVLIGQWGDLADGPVTAFGMVTLDRFGTFFKLFTCGSLAVVTLFVMLDKRERKHGIGEYYFLLCGAAIGIFFMVSTNNLLLLMLGLELLSLASYSLAGFHKGSKKSAEASLKYVVFGGLSAGVMLYGISLMYGLTGTIDLAVMGGAAGGDGEFPMSLATQFELSPVPVAVAVVLVFAGFAYKVSVVPFHFWTPDVYQGAPTPVTTFLAVASKAAGFAVMLRFVGALFLTEGVDDLVAAYGDRISLLLALLAAVTMTLGNLSALRQSNLKRMLAYSSIAHAGYVLMGLATMTGAGFSASIYYLAAYYFMNLGAFGFLLYFEGVTGSEEMDSLKGMGWRHPVVAWTMVVFLVSLTGLPPTIGFYGKYLLFVEGIAAGLGWLAVVMALNSVVSLFYYLRVAKSMFFTKPEEPVAIAQPGLAGLLVVLGILTATAWIGPSLEEWSDEGPASLGIPLERTLETASND